MEKEGDWGRPHRGTSAFSLINGVDSAREMAAAARRWKRRGRPLGMCGNAVAEVCRELLFLFFILGLLFVTFGAWIGGLWWSGGGYSPRSSM